MSDTQLQKSSGRNVLKERGQYLLAFGVVASMLWVADFPIFVIFFFGIFAYFLVRLFSSGSRSETREVFEFYLTANEILRDDERRWYGFEIHDAIGRGEDIVRRMNPAPPLVYFSLGALQNKAGDHKAAMGNLGFVVENPAAEERSYMTASPELQSYVRILRKIEREPADAPLTSAAVRALERARRIRAKALLEDSREKFTSIPVSVGQPIELEAATSNGHAQHEHEDASADGQAPPKARLSIVDSEPISDQQSRSNGAKPHPEKVDPYVDRKSISEVLHDIYDKNIQ